MTRQFRNPALILFIVCALCLFLNHAAAAGIKERMKARVPEINTLKSQGVVGENNKGYLEIRQQGGGQALVNDENVDRKKVYTAIAKQQGASADLVGKRRAKQIAQRAKPGTWLQNEQGEWYKK